MPAPGSVDGGARLASPQQALSAVCDAAAALTLTPRWHRRSLATGRDAWQCTLYQRNRTQAPFAHGLGTGNHLTGRLAAAGEALERFLCGPARFRPEHTRLRPAETLAAGPLSEEALAPLLASYAGSRLACWDYEPPKDQQPLAVPVFLSAPWYADASGAELRRRAGDETRYGALARYAVGSGHALGTGSTEATVHALYETIERDAASLLLARVFLSASPQLTRIDPATLPTDLAQLHTTLRHRLGRDIHLLDITADLDVPVALAYSTPTPYAPYLRGQGSSLDPGHAVRRALEELAEHVLAQAPAPDLRPLRRYPALRSCAEFDLTPYLPRTQTIPFRDRPAPTTAAGHHDALLERLTAHGFSVYRHTLHHHRPSRVTAVHVLVPGLERFFAIVNGTLALPGPRARAAYGADPHAALAHRTTA